MCRASMSGNALEKDIGRISINRITIGRRISDKQKSLYEVPTNRAIRKSGSNSKIIIIWWMSLHCFYSTSSPYNFHDIPGQHSHEDIQDLGATNIQDAKATKSPIALDTGIEGIFTPKSNPFSTCVGQDGVLFCVSPHPLMRFCGSNHYESCSAPGLRRLSRWVSWPIKICLQIARQTLSLEGGRGRNLVTGDYRINATQTRGQKNVAMKLLRPPWISGTQFWYLLQKHLHYMLEVWFLFKPIQLNFRYYSCHSQSS